MESTSYHITSSTPHHELNTMSFLKLEDIENSSLPTSSLDDDNLLMAPPPVIVHSKQAKKRKSWGQELPEPTTMLPPRKRAKTDDEKEQRRIERIKRNRAAAHNSRERKRQETETLAVALARANAELEAYRKHFGALPSNIVLPEVTVSIDSADSPVPSLTESSRDSIHAMTSPATPADDQFDSPMIKEEQYDETPMPSLFADITNTVPTSTTQSKPQYPQPRLDSTQHSAVSVDSPQGYSVATPAFAITNNDNNPPAFNLNTLVEQPYAPHDDPAHPDLLQIPSPGPLDPFAFTNQQFVIDQAYSSYTNPLFDHSFNISDFINDDEMVSASSVAV